MPALFLRIASASALVQAVLHTIGGVFGKPRPGAAQAAVLTMQSNSFMVVGHPRTYFDFYIGFGLAITVFLAIEAGVFWQLGSLAKNGAHRLHPIIATFLIGYLALAVDAQAYFFVGPVICDVLIALCLGLAIFTSRQSLAS
jgi:hypothetical protein